MSCATPTDKIYRRVTCSPKRPPQPLCETLREADEARCLLDTCECKEDKCGLQPRRIPLLGTEDPPSEKSKRAFGMQAEQGIWDIGKPLLSRVYLPLRRSRFRVRYERGLYPFHLDYSADVSIDRITWCVDMGQYDITDLLKDTLEAQSDDSHWAHVGHLVFMDLLKHLPPAKLAGALPSFSIEFRKMMRRNNEEIARRLMKMLKELALVVTSIGPELAFYAHDLFNLCNQWLERYMEVGDRIVYEQKKCIHLNDLTDELHAIFEVVSGAEHDYAVAGMKLAIPTYRIPEKAANPPGK
ncbi:Parkin co regulated protein [Echinococcus multilocularis]|uniref:Parkin co regulated protein n=1 Tax=Echinococcus multilocularis TaxID=6211 RepID=A0A068Y3J3_ECHMU|nr:Parkin co regulated protein [Echinococcus multilocularis]